MRAGFSPTAADISGDFRVSREERTERRQRGDADARASAAMTKMYRRPVSSYHSLVEASL